MKFAIPLSLMQVLLAASALAQQQPVPYSHKLHAGDLKLKCAKCHPNPDPGETMTFPQPEVCGECHKGQYDHEIRWVRVYQIPGFVDFSHRDHLAAGNTCEECHGPVARRAQLTRETDLTMGGCMECHRVKKADIGCNYCHAARTANIPATPKMPMPNNAKLVGSGADEDPRIAVNVEFPAELMTKVP